MPVTPYCIDAAWLTRPATRAVIALLEDAGHQALFVGGCVRDALLGQAADDVDLATDALPDIVSDLARTAGMTVIPTGLAHGTVTVMSDGVPHEVTTFRRDLESDGRHATVAFSTTVADDASRRDFTINALYAMPTGEVVDPLGGLADLHARHVRFVGDPDARIQEDYLRILRFFRFTARFGDPDLGIDADALAACAAHIDGLDRLSHERIGWEMRKLLALPDPTRAVAAMARIGILSRLLPGADDAALHRLIHAEDRPSSWILRLAMLGGEDATHALRLSNREAEALRTTRLHLGTAAGPAELAYRYGPDLAAAICRGRSALLEMPPGDCANAIARGAAATFPVVAADLMPALQGRDLGDRLRALEDTWIASDLRLSRDDLLA